MRPLRSATPVSASRKPHLSSALAFTRFASSSSSSSSSYSLPAASRPPASTPRRPPSFVPAARSRLVSSRIRTDPSHARAPDDASNPPVLDPQAAVPPGASFADIDPSLARAIPAAPPPAAVDGGAFAAAVERAARPPPLPGAIDWSSSFHGLSTAPFSAETAALLMQPLRDVDIEVKPDGILYLPEIKYRRILNLAFGPGGWGLAPRGELVVGEKVVTREYALIVHGRFIAQARGECQYFSAETIPTAGEGCKSNALLRCCKDLGIASELWDPRFIRQFKKDHCQEIWVEHVVNKKRRQIWTLKGVDPAYPYQTARASTR